MRTVTCPVCTYGFVKRHGARHCPACSTILVREGETFRRDGHRVFLWLSDREVWSEIPAP